MAVTFQTSLRQAQSKNATGIPVPSEAVAELGGGKTPLVQVTVNGYTYRGKVASMGGELLIGFSAEHRAASGIVPGAAIEVTLELDDAPRTVEVPDDLRTALEAAGRFADFEAAAPSRKKEFVRQVEEAKSAETRARRIQKVVDGLG